MVDTVVVTCTVVVAWITVLRLVGPTIVIPLLTFMTVEPWMNVFIST